MRRIEHSFQQFIDAIHTADDEAGFERVAARVAQNLGFRWFAYLCLNGDTSTLISSYPKSWTRRYFNLSYQHLDPVVRRARAEHDLFSWGGGASAPAGNREQRKFFEEATTFGIKSGITVPIRGGFGRTAAFTLATDEATALSERFVAESKDVLQLVGIYFHTHVTARSSPGPGPGATQGVLTQRERQCLAWTAQGKSVADIAILTEIAPRTVTFHLGNARRKLNASSVAQCVAEAMRRRLLP